MSSVSFLDKNKDNYWSEADDLKGTETYYNTRFGQQGNLPRIFRAFMEDAKGGKFVTQIKENLDAPASKAATSDFTRIPMQWLRDEQPLISLCNSVDPHLCGNLEVRDILKAHFPSEQDPTYRVRKCRENWNRCEKWFGELYHNYFETGQAVCSDRTPFWDSENMVTINRYERADKYSPRVNEKAIVSTVYESFLLLVLVIWWLTVLGEFRAVMSWWVTVILMPAGQTTVKEDEDTIQVVSISLCSKICICLFVTLPRTIIIVALAYIGTDFLIIVDGYGDLILNSVALGFLIEVDEMIFAGVASQHDQEDVQKWAAHGQSIETTHDCNERCVELCANDVSVPLLLSVLAMCLAQMWKAYHWKDGKVDLMGAYECLCHNEGEHCVAAKLLGHKLSVPAQLIDPNI